ncbi:MAG TPA: phosphatidylglycerol lysyltransferase domain-containing protein, partial [Nannocystaceae bacterium]|nr:phosphatidylglycerol lysyltransferase domain-containing protein [Nannocystaceae bacterium]
PAIDRWIPHIAEPRGSHLVGNLVTLVIGLSLLFIADQVAAQKRMALWFTGPLFAAAAIVHAALGHHLTAAFAALMALAFAGARRRFHAPPDPPSLLRLARFAPLYLLAVLLFGVSSLLVERDQITPALSVGGVLLAIADAMIGAPGPYTFEGPLFARFFPVALQTLGIAGLAASLVLLFRPLTALAPHTRDDWARAERLIREHGDDTLAAFALRDDKSFFFASDGEAMIAFTYVLGYALASGDPIGAPASIPRVVDEFLAFCRERAWSPAFLAVRQADLPLYAARGLRHVYLGDEAIIRCDRFTLAAAHRSVRDAVRRLGRRYRLEVLAEASAPAPLVRALNDLSARWRGKAPEQGFTMSLSQRIEGEGRNSDFLLCVALDERSAPAGFLRLIPIRGAAPGYTLDMMRHDPDAPNGMTEFQVAQSALELRRRGAVRLSLNFAGFRRFFTEGPPLTLGQRAGGLLVRALNPFFQIKSLHAFNAKFAPEWSPRVLVFRRSVEFPRVGLRYIGAEGLLAIPVVGRLFIPRAVGGVPRSEARDGPPASS